MGLSNDEWNALPPEQRAELRIEDRRLQVEARIRSEEEARRQREVREAKEKARQQALVERRAIARYGDIVVVTLQGGTLIQNDRRYILEPLVFELLRGEHARIQLTGHRASGSHMQTLYEKWSVSFSEDGHTVRLNDTGRGPPIVLVDNNTWEKGQTVALVAGGQFQSGMIELFGMAATIRYKNLPGSPPRVIIEER